LTTQPEAQADAGATAIEAKEPAKARSGRVVIQPHNNLWKLSRVIYGRGAHYRVIYSANKDQIHNPNRIYPGQIFTIPNASPPESIDPKRKEPLTADEGAGSVE
jgi:nucleoid-associated protein YgaU